MKPLTWTVEITFSEDEDRTRADAMLTDGAEGLQGWGRARRNPVDPDVPAIGEDIAAARALSDLAHHLLERAAHRIESWEGRPVDVSR
jgi:Rv2632c-like